MSMYRYHFIFIFAIRRYVWHLIFLIENALNESVVNNVFVCIENVDLTTIEVSFIRIYNLYAICMISMTHTKSTAKKNFVQLDLAC